MGSFLIRQKLRPRWFVPLAWFFFFILVIAFFSLNNRSFQSPLVGQFLPKDLMVFDYEKGEKRNLQPFLQEGKKLLYFWSGKCYSCLQELDQIAETFANLSFRSEIGSVILFNSCEDLPQILEDHPYPFSLFCDFQGTTGLKFGITKVPEVFFLENGHIVLHETTSMLQPETLKKIKLFFQGEETWISQSNQN